MNVVILLGIFDFAIATLGLYFQLKKNERGYAFTCYIVTVIGIYFTLISYKEAKNVDTPQPTQEVITNSGENTPDNGGRTIEIGEEEDIPQYSETPSDEEVFNGSELAGQLGDEEEYITKYKALKAGVYRFDFDINDVNNEYYFSINDLQGTELIYKYSSEGGATVTLESGQIYEIRVGHSEGDVEYAIKINTPTDMKQVTDNLIKDKISYINQENEYQYVPSITGTYRFDFDIDDVNNEYYFYIYDEKQEQIVNKSSLNEGATVELAKDTTYKLKVIQAAGTPQYSILIGIPNKIRNLKHNKMKGKLDFKDKSDVYLYKAPRTGRYRFDFGINDVTKNYYIEIRDSKNEQIFDISSSNEGRTVDLKGGEVYKIYVKQGDGFSNYSINIGVPSKTVTTNRSTVTGKIYFVDQQNIYNYRVNSTGRYILTFDINNVDCQYSIMLRDRKNSIIFDTSSSNLKYEIDLKKNEKYKLYVTYSNGFLEYNINFKKLS